MTRAVIAAKRFIVCPKCERGEFSIEHLFAKDAAWRHAFGPWPCHERGCDATIRGHVNEDDSIEITVGSKKHKPGLTLLKIGDLWLVEEAYRHYDPGDDHWDYHYHSHQCLTNLLHSIEKVFDGTGEDPHGRLRFVANIEDTPEIRERLDKISGLEALFQLFGTDGQPAPSTWPEENRGVIPWIAEMQRAGNKERS